MCFTGNEYTWAHSEPTRSRANRTHTPPSSLCRRLERDKFEAVIAEQAAGAVGDGRSHENAPNCGVGVEIALEGVDVSAELAHGVGADAATFEFDDNRAAAESSP